MKTRALCLLVVAGSLVTAASADQATLDAVLARHLEARGGGERWREVSSLELRGTYAAFSDREPFTLLRARGDLYRLDFRMLGGDAVRARDAEGVWWRHPLLHPAAGRLTEGPYRAQLERESVFGPLLLDPAARGVSVELAATSELEGVPVIELAITLADGRRETWYLDAETYLEVAVDSEVHDHTQSMKPMRQRAFFADFRRVDGLVIPFRLDYEFGHRLESMTVEEAIVDGDLDRARFSPPR